MIRWLRSLFRRAITASSTTRVWVNGRDIQREIDALMHRAFGP